MKFENSLFSNKKIVPKIKQAILLGATIVAGVEGAACAPPKADSNGRPSTARVERARGRERAGNPLPVPGEHLAADFDPEYRANLQQSMRDHLSTIRSEKGRSKEAAKLQKELARVLESVWKKRFAGNDNGQRAYFETILEDVNYRERVRLAIDRACAEFDVPRSLVFGIVGVEGGGRQQIESSTGALGIMQVTPAAAVEAGIFTREQLYDRDKNGNFTVLNSEKDQALRQRLRQDLELNMRAGVGYVKVLAGRLNNDWGLAAGMYCTRPNEFRQFIVEGYNKKLRVKYDLQLVTARSRGHKLPPPPAYMTTESVSRYGWSRWLADNHISSMSLMVDGRSFYPTDEYPFQVMVLGPLVESILTSREEKVYFPSLVDDVTRAKLAARRPPR